MSSAPVRISSSETSSSTSGSSSTTSGSSSAGRLLLAARAGPRASPRRAPRPARARPRRARRSSAGSARRSSPPWASRIAPIRSPLRLLRKPSRPSSDAIACRSASGLDSSSLRWRTVIGRGTLASGAAARAVSCPRATASSTSSISRASVSSDVGVVDDRHALGAGPLPEVVLEAPDLLEVRAGSARRAASPGAARSGRGAGPGRRPPPAPRPARSARARAGERRPGTTCTPSTTTGLPSAAARSTIAAMPVPTRSAWSR